MDRAPIISTITTKEVIAILKKKGKLLGDVNVPMSDLPILLWELIATSSDPDLLDVLEDIAQAAYEQGIEDGVDNLNEARAVVKNGSTKFPFDLRMSDFNNFTENVTEAAIENSNKERYYYSLNLVMEMIELSYVKAERAQSFLAQKENIKMVVSSVIMETSSFFVRGRLNEIAKEIEKVGKDVLAPTEVWLTDEEYKQMLSVALEEIAKILEEEF